MRRGRVKTSCCQARWLVPSAAGLGEGKGLPRHGHLFPRQTGDRNTASSLIFTTWTLLAVCRGWSFLTAMLQFRNTLLANSTTLALWRQTTREYCCFLRQLNNRNPVLVRRPLASKANKMMGNTLFCKLKVSSTDWRSRGRSAHQIPGACVCIDAYSECALSCFSCVWLCVTLWTVARQAPPLSMGFSRQVYWSGLPFPSSGKWRLQCKKKKNVAKLLANIIKIWPY